jgi:hypothetical protein
MLNLVLIICTLICAFFIARYFVFKTQVSEKGAADVIARKLKTSPVMAELSRLTEENMVMRNLLIDMVENETSGPSSTAHLQRVERERLFMVAKQRRREIVGEAIYLIRQSKGPLSQEDETKIVS